MQWSKAFMGKSFQTHQKGSLINDVTQLWAFSDPPLKSRTNMFSLQIIVQLPFHFWTQNGHLNNGLVRYLDIHCIRLCQKTNSLPPGTLVTSFMNVLKAITNLLDQCIYTIGRTTYVDFFPFYDLNCIGSEMNLLKVCAHFT
jgi:hypothetical protein